MLVCCYIVKPIHKRLKIVWILFIIFTEIPAYYMKNWTGIQVSFPETWIGCCS